MLNFNKRLKTVIITALATFALLLGMIAFAFINGGATQKAEAASSEGVVNVTLSFNKATYDVVNDTQVIVSINVQKAAGVTAPIGSVQGNLYFDSSAFTISNVKDADFIPHSRWYSDSAITPRLSSGYVFFSAAANGPANDLNDTSFVAMQLIFTVKSGISAGSYGFYIKVDKKFEVSNMCDSATFTQQTPHTATDPATAVFTAPSADATGTLKVYKGSNSSGSLLGTKAFTDADISSYKATFTVPTNVEFSTVNPTSLFLVFTPNDTSASVTGAGSVSITAAQWGSNMSYSLTDKIKVTPAVASAAVQYTIVIQRAAPDATSKCKLTITNSTVTSINELSPSSNDGGTVTFANRNNAKLTFTPTSPEAQLTTTTISYVKGNGTPSTFNNGNAIQLTQGTNTVTVEVKSQACVAGINAAAKTTYTVTIVVSPAKTDTNGTVTLTNVTSGGSITLTGTTADATKAVSTQPQATYENHKKVKITASADTAVGASLGTITLNGSTISNNTTPTLTKGVNTLKVVIKSEAAAESASAVTEYTITIEVGDPDMTIASAVLKKSSTTLKTGTFNSGDNRWEFGSATDAVSYLDSLASLSIIATPTSALINSSAVTPSAVGSFTSTDYDNGYKDVILTLKMDNNDTQTWTARIFVAPPSGDAGATVALSGGHTVAAQNIVEGLSITGIPYDAHKNVAISIVAVSPATLGAIKVNGTTFTSGNKPNLTKGSNTVEVTVTAQNGTPTTYHFSLVVDDPVMTIANASLKNGSTVVKTGTFNSADNRWEFGTTAAPIDYNMSKNSLTILAHPTSSLITSAAVTPSSVGAFTTADWAQGYKDVTLTLKMDNNDTQPWTARIFVAPPSEDANGTIAFSTGYVLAAQPLVDGMEVGGTEGISYAYHANTKITLTVTSSGASLGTVKFNNVVQSWSANTAKQVNLTGSKSEVTDNVLEVQINAQSGTPKTYTVHIKVGKPDMTIKNVALKQSTTQLKAGTFNSSTQMWEIGSESAPVSYVDSQKANLNISAERNSSLANATITGATAVTFSQTECTEGHKDVTLTLTMDNSETQEWTVRIYLQGPSTEANGTITLSGGFSYTGALADGMEIGGTDGIPYTAHKTTKIALAATSPATLGTVTLNGSSFTNPATPTLNGSKSGVTDNVLIVEVKAQSGTPTTYTVHIKVGSPDMSLSSVSLRIAGVTNPVAGTFNTTENVWEICKDSPLTYEQSSKKALTLVALPACNLINASAVTGSVGNFTVTDYTLGYRETVLTLTMDNGETQEWGVRIYSDPPSGDTNATISVSGVGTGLILDDGLVIDIPYKAVSAAKLTISVTAPATLGTVTLNGTAINSTSVPAVSNKAITLLADKDADKDNALVIIIKAQDESENTYNVNLKVKQPDLSIKTLSLNQGSTKIKDAVYNPALKKWEIGSVSSPVSFTDSQKANLKLVAARDTSLAQANITGAALAGITFSVEECQSGSKETSLTVTISGASDITTDWGVIIYLESPSADANGTITLGGGYEYSDALSDGLVIGGSVGIPYEQHKTVKLTLGVTAPAKLGEVTLNGTAINTTSVPAVNNKSIELRGSKNSDLTENNLVVNVVAQDNSTVTYNVVIKVAKPDASIKNVQVTVGGSPIEVTYNPTEGRWEAGSADSPLSYEDSKKAIAVTAEKNTALSGVNVTVPSGIAFNNSDYAQGYKSVPVTVTMDNGEETQIPVLIYAQGASDDASASIVLKGGTPISLEKDVTKSIAIPYEEHKSTSVEFVYAGKSCEIKLNGADFTNNTTPNLNGSKEAAETINEFKVKVTAQDGTTVANYTVQLKVGKPDMTLSSVKLTIPDSPEKVGEYKDISSKWEIGSESNPLSYSNSKKSIDLVGVARSALASSVQLKSGETLAFGAADYAQGYKDVVLELTMDNGETADWATRIYVKAPSNDASLKTVTLTKGATEYSAVLKDTAENGAQTWEFSTPILADDKMGWDFAVETTSESSTKQYVFNSASWTGGVNTVNVKVTAEDGTEVTHEIKVTVTSDNSTDIDTITLTRTDIGGNTKDVELKKNLTGLIYTVTLAADEGDGLKLSATTANEDSIVSIRLVSGSENLASATHTVTAALDTLVTGTHTFYVNVKADENSTDVGTYTVVITVQGVGDSAKATFRFYTLNADYSYKITAPTDTVIAHSLSIPANLPRLYVQALPVEEGANVIIYTMTNDMVVIETYSNGDLVSINDSRFSYISIVVTSPNGKNTMTYNFVTAPMSVNITITVPTDEYKIDQNEFYDAAKKAFEKYVTVDRNTTSYLVKIGLPSGGIYKIELISGTLYEASAGLGNIPASSVTDTDLLKNYRFALQDGLNVFVFRITDTATQSEKICVLRVNKEVAKTSNVGLIVALIIFAVLFVVAVIVMSVFIAKYVSAKKSGFKTV